MNLVVLTGRLTGVPDLRYTRGGTAVANANLAVDDGWGEDKKTLFIGVTFWGNTAEVAQKHATKGQVLIVYGRLSQDTYKPEGSDKEVRKTHVTCERFEFGERPRGSERPGGNGNSPSTPSETSGAQTDHREDLEPDDIPF